MAKLATIAVVAGVTGTVGVGGGVGVGDPTPVGLTCVEWWPGGGCCPATWFPGATQEAGPIGICRPAQPRQAPAGGAASNQSLRSVVGRLDGQTRCSCASADASEIAFPSAGCRIVWVPVPGVRARHARAWPNNNTVIAIAPDVGLCLVSSAAAIATVPGTLTLTGSHAGECAYVTAPRGRAPRDSGASEGEVVVVTSGYSYATYARVPCTGITSRAACPPSRCWWNATTRSCTLPAPSPPPRHPREPTPALLEKVARIFSARLSFGAADGVDGSGVRTTTMGLTFGTPNTTAASYRPVVRWGASANAVVHGRSSVAACASSAAGRTCYTTGPRMHYCNMTKLTPGRKCVILECPPNKFCNKGHVDALDVACWTAAKRRTGGSSPTAPRKASDTPLWWFTVPGTGTTLATSRWG